MSQIELLKSRAEQIVAGVKSSIEAGLDPYVADYARKVTEYGASTLTQDMWLVLLGLKPVASFTINGAGYFRFGDKHVIDFIAAPNGYTTLYDEGPNYIWNPRLVSEILGRYPKANPYSYQINPFEKKEFPKFIERICHGAISGADTYLAGLLHGIPAQAARDFVRFRPALIPTVQLVWSEARRMGIETRFPDPSHSYLNSPIEVRDEFARLAQAAGIEGPRNILNYVRFVRSSQTPGSPYLTSGIALSGHEKKLTRLYELSGLETKLDEVMNKYVDY